MCRCRSWLPYRCTAVVFFTSRTLGIIRCVIIFVLWRLYFDSQGHIRDLTNVLTLGHFIQRWISGRRKYSQARQGAKTYMEMWSKIQRQQEYFRRSRSKQDQTQKDTIRNEKKERKKKWFVYFSHNFEIVSFINAIVVSQSSFTFV